MVWYDAAKAARILDRSLAYIDGFQSGYEAQIQRIKEVKVPYVDNQKDAFIAGVYHGRTEALAQN
jgi:hypothetical protein